MYGELIPRAASAQVTKMPSHTAATNSQCFRRLYEQHYNVSTVLNFIILVWCVTRVNVRLTQAVNFSVTRWRSHSTDATACELARSYSLTTTSCHDKTCHAVNNIKWKKSLTSAVSRFDFRIKRNADTAHACMRFVILNWITAWINNVRLHQLIRRPVFSCFVKCI